MKHNNYVVEDLVVQNNILLSGNRKLRIGIENVELKHSVDMDKLQMFWKNVTYQPIALSKFRVQYEKIYQIQEPINIFKHKCNDILIILL